MWPILVDVGPAGSGAVPTYLVFVLSAFATGCLWVHRRAPKVGINPDSLVGLYVVAAITGWVGARLLHFVGGEWDRFVVEPGLFFDPQAGGLAFLGGVAGGLLGGAVYARFQELPGWKLADVVAVALMVGLGIGRLGCFFGGCCHGRLCAADGGGVLLDLPGGEVWWTEGLPLLALRHDAGAVADQLVYPTQLMESAGVLALAGGLHWLTRRARRFDGQVLAVMLAAYGLLRFLVEGLRGDLVRGADHIVLGVPWSTGQLSSLALLVGAGVVVAMRWRAGVTPETSYQDVDDGSILASDLPE